MDAFAVSVANGIVMKRAGIREGLIFGLFFGGFQFIMPILGFGLGRAFYSYISVYSHWIAFALLVFIGVRMIYESFSEYSVQLIETSRKRVTVLAMGMMAVATSVDACAVGVGFALLDNGILGSAAVIGGVAFAFSFAGVFLGKRLGDVFKSRAEQLGGAILVLIGIKIVLEHIF